MKFNSSKGYSLIEIGIALIIIAIFMVSSITLLAGSNENYRMIEQRSLALSYAMKAIEATTQTELGLSVEEIQITAQTKNNMEVEVLVENLPPKDDINYGDKVQIVTANVSYHIKSNDAGSLKTLTLQTLKINN